MNIEKNFPNNKNLWWLEFVSVSTTSTLFNYDLQTNIIFLSIPKSTYSLFFTVQKYSTTTLFFNTLDIAAINYNTNNLLYHTTQSVFNDIKICVETKINNKITTTSNVYSGNTWPERELKEFSQISVVGLVDTRKLLLNYNYNTNLNYNHYNTIISDCNI